MKGFFIFFLTVICLHTRAQEHNMIGDAAEQNLRALGSHGSTDQIRTFNNRYEGVRGNPFLSDQWHSAVIITTKRDTLQTFIKLDIYSDNVWAILHRGDSIIVDKGLISSFSFHDPKLARQRTFFFDPHLLGYFELLYKGNTLSLAGKRRKELLKAVVSGGYSSGNPYDEFIAAKTQFFVIKDGKLHLMRSRRNSIRELLGPEAAAKAMHEPPLNLKDEEQVISLVQYADMHQ